jgi:large subunit ribosomal protein L19
MDVIKTFELGQKKAEIPEFAVGDTVRVSLKIKEGDKERLQPFEGVVIAKRNAGARSSFTVRKVSYGIGVERIIPLYSPALDGLKVIRQGTVRRSKLYYLRDLSGKAARIKEKQDW